MEVYVSSSFADLRAYREAAFNVLARLDVRYTAMELFSATDALPVERCIEAVQRSDALVLIVGHRYGFVPHGYEKSITQLDYDEARRNDLPVFAFVLSEEVPVAVSDIELDESLRHRLASFRSELARNLIFGVVTSVSDFQSQLTSALFNWLRAREVSPPRTSAENQILELETEVDRQKEIIRDLQNRLTRIVPATPIWRGRNFATDALACFVLMPFQDQFFEAYEAAVAPAVERCGLTAKHAGEMFGNREIIEDIWDSICSARVVIADVTGRNPNVFYELGVCHTLGKECIVMTQADADVPFDIRHRRYLRYDPGKLVVLRFNLERTIKAVLTQATIEDVEGV
jgi:Domain of unknown function (DUF4062)